MATLSQQFADFMAITLSAQVGSKDDIPNLSTLNKYATLKRIWPGNTDQLFVQGGTQLIDHVQLEFVSQVRDYSPNDTTPPVQNPNVLTAITAPWRFRMNQLGWVDQQVILNMNASGTSTLREAFKNEKEKIMQNANTAWMENLEMMFWDTPNTTTMESTSADPGRPYSIPVWCNENTNGLFPSVSPGGAWTTKSGVNPAAAGKSKWDNQRFTFSTFDLATAPSAGVSPINMAFMDAWMRTKFTAPPDRQKYFQTDDLRSQVIWASGEGMKMLQSALIRKGSMFLGLAKDPSIPNMTFFGIDCEWNQALDTAVLYMNAGSTALAAEGAIGSAALLKNGPRYYFYGSGPLKYVVHKDRWMEATPPMRVPGQPFSWVSYYDVWHQVWPVNPRKLAIVSPSTNVW